ncbi:gluconokinase [Luteolibacter flavescens]|uniref:Gluconokinase n=1 Tax=Luteolibacter flavescens TaxID=1859460 RepID=A0ABT3FQ44_9BACT|nr:gluconokinase [Luteolibacter flavescens]MCW1885703.1 gluconokinase [Luteolibacter flavescens]
MRIVIAGVSGSGKTTIGMLVADRLGCEFADADGFHPPENIAKMSAGIPLDDSDREGWLEALGEYMAGRESIVLACSALKKKYRDHLRGLAGPVRFCVLTAGRGLLEERLSTREHFMPASLLDSQLDTLELGEDVVVIENAAAPEEVAERLIAGLPDKG